VIANQDVQVEWVNGHDSDCYWILTSATDGIKNLRKTNTALLEDYINNAPAAQQVPPPARWQKYHRKYNNVNLDNKAGDAFFQAAIKPTDNNPNYIPRPDNFEGSFSGAPSGKGENGNVSLFMQMVYFQNTSCTMNDRRVQYNNPLYPWIIAVHRYRLCTGQGGRPDVARLTFPPGTKPGHYMAQWQWRGYYDVVDVEIVNGTTPVVKPYGDKVPEPPKGMRAQYKRVDHCAFPDAQPVKGCYRIMTDADACMRMCDRATEFACTGVQITPVLPRSSVYAGFRNITFMPYDFPSNCRKADIERGALPGHFACWPLQARPRTDTVDRFVISLDPDDPVFYSTCYTRISYKVASNVTVAPEPRELAWQFGKKCISCNGAAAATVEYAQPLWNITDTCANCDVDKRTVAQLPAAEKPINWTIPAPWKTSSCRSSCAAACRAATTRRVPTTACVNTTACGVRLNTVGGAQQADISELDCQMLAKADARCSSLVTLYYEPSLERNFCTCFRGTYKNTPAIWRAAASASQQNTTAQWRAFENS
jgi:hypothetical protein